MTASSPDRRAALVRAVADPGYTPGRADLPEVIGLLADPEAADDAERALIRAGASAGPALVRHLPAAEGPQRARVVRALGRVAVGDAVLEAALETCLEDPDPKARRLAIAALGKLGRADVGARLLAHAREERSLPHLRSYVEALGKSGVPAALGWLTGLQTEDPELRRLADRAVLMLRRSLDRPESAPTIDLDAAPPAPRTVRLTCRAGVEPLLVEELGPAWSPRALAAGRVELTLAAPLRGLLQARTWIELGFPLTPRPRSGELAPALTELLAGPEAWEVFRTWTQGQVRYRIAFVGGGHRRAVVWQVAKAVAAARPELVNDPQGSTWEVLVDESGAQLRVELRPRKLGEPRFAYRGADVPAASHPTLAAALARVAGVEADDVVWDPFVGSGLELCERGLLGPFRALHGSDLDPRALAVSASNLGAAGLSASLAQANATEYAPPDLTLIVTNPPMGRRVQRGDVGPLLEAFVAHAAEVLRPGGRLVWISPISRRTDVVARRVGLRLRKALAIDMGGFPAQLQRWDRP